jgi:CRP/FNR family cyclic AMP-dependent transcriptional regulator
VDDDPRKFGLFRHTENTIRFPAGSTVFAAGDGARSMYAIKSGKVAIQVGGRSIRTLEEGEVFGEMALLNHHVRSATVIALEDSELVEIDEPHFLFLVRQNPYFSLQLMRLLSERLRDRDPLTPLEPRPAT